MGAEEDKLLQVAMINHLLKKRHLPPCLPGALWPWGGHNQPAKGPYILLHPATALSFLLTPYRLQRPVPHETRTHKKVSEEHIPHSSLLLLCCCYTHIRSSVSSAQLPPTCFLFIGCLSEGLTGAPTRQSNNATTNLWSWPCPAFFSNPTLEKKK